jgi:hypothetical protein
MPRGVYDRTKTKVKRSTSKATEDYRRGYRNGIKDYEALGRDVECKAYAQGYYDAFEDSSEK